MIYSYIPESRAGHEAFDPWAATREPYPPPLYRSSENRDLPFPEPPAVKAVRALAVERGWTALGQYSRGHLPHATTGKPTAVRDLIGLRFGISPLIGMDLWVTRQAYAVYSRPVSGGTWMWSSVMIWGSDLTPYAGCSITDLKAYLMMAPEVRGEALEDWVRDLRSIKSKAAQLVKQRVAARGPVSKRREVG